MAKNGIGDDAAGYASAIASTFGAKGLAKGLGTIQGMKENKRNRAAKKEVAAIWRPHTTGSGSVNDND